MELMSTSVLPHNSQILKFQETYISIPSKDNPHYYNPRASSNMQMCYHPKIMLTPNSSCRRTMIL